MRRSTGLGFLFLLFFGLNAGAQAQIYRCGNEYLNDARQAQLRGCVLVEGGYVTVVPGTQVARPAASAAAVPVNPAAPLAPLARAEARSEARPAAEQRARDADARLILDAELKRAEARLAQLQKEFNGGEPDKQGIESRNHQRYLDRVSELKAAMARDQSDIASLKRELARLPAPP
jgi:hypothetical protein